MSFETGHFAEPVFNLDTYVEMEKLEAQRRVAAKSRFLDDKKAGIVYSSPMKKGTYELNKNYQSLHVGDQYQEPGKQMAKAKVQSKERWLDDKKAGIRYASPLKTSSTPGDAYGSISGTNIEAFPPFGNYPARGVRQKVDVENLKEQRQIQTNPSKRGMGGYVAHSGVLMGGFPKYVDGNDIDAMKKKEAADLAAHKAAQAAVDEKCRFVSTAKPPPLFDTQPNVDAPTCLSLDPDCIIGPLSALETANPKERAQMINARYPWRESGDKTWRHASGTKSGRHGNLNKFPQHMADKFDDHQIRECQTPLRRMGWHRHVAAGAVGEGVADRKPFKPSQGVGHKKLSTSVMFSSSALRRGR